MTATRRAVILSLAAFVAATTTGCWSSSPANEPMEYDPADVGIMEGDVPPDFTLKLLNSDETVQLARRIGKGRPVVLVFGSYT